MDKIDYLLKAKKEYQQSHALLIHYATAIGKSRPITRLSREVCKLLGKESAEQLKLYRGCCYALAPLMCGPPGDVARLIYKTVSGNYSISPCPKELEFYRNHVDIIAEHNEYVDWYNAASITGMYDI